MGQYIIIPLTALLLDSLVAQEQPGKAVEVDSEIIVREVPQPDGLQPLLAFGSEEGHFLYDPNTLIMRGLWKGVFGWQAEGGHFIPNEKELRSFSLKRSPWSYGEKPRREVTHDWLGHEIRNGQVWLRYRLEDETSGMSWQIGERLEVISDEIQRLHFKIEPSEASELYLNYWVTQTDFRRLATNGQPNQRNKLKNLFPDQKDFTITFVRRREAPTMPNGYSVETIALPEARRPFQFEPTAIDFAPNGDVYVSTRNGYIWRRHNGRWSVFADGLHEANGIRVTPAGDGVYVMQKPELTLLQDTDGDGVADVYHSAEARFRFTGQYHEFAYGPRMNSKGDLFFSTGLASSGYHRAAPDGSPNQMTSPLGYRGWVIKRDQAGNITPFACGLRSPAGIGMNAEDELFVTDNQGDWVASSYLAHVEEGDFLGHPASLWDRKAFGITPPDLDYKNVTKIPETVPTLDSEMINRERKPPAVWLSHGDLTNSPGHPSFAPASGFGPFAGQAFIADISHRTIVRVALEKIGGHYQGAVFPFIRPLGSASYSTAFDPEGNLWVGSVGRGWTVGDPAIEIIRFDPSEAPFEMQRIELTEDGFDICFTQPLAAQPIAPADISVGEFRYRYWDGYGSEPLDERTVPVSAIKRSEDGLKLSLSLQRRKGFIYQIQLPNISSGTGLVLENNYGLYTLNRLLP